MQQPFPGSSMASEARERSWVYLSQLVRALQLQGVDGRSIGEMVVEIEQHLVDSGADPVDEFGPPPQLAEELAARPESRRPGWVPPLWMNYLLGFVIMVLLIPLVPTYWTEDAIPVRAGMISFAVLAYGGATWLGYRAHQRLDGRNWNALLGWRPALVILAFALAVSLVVPISDDRVLIEFPKVPFLLGCAILIPAIIVFGIRNPQRVRFPASHRYLHRLKRGPYAGAPPAEYRAG